MKDKTKFKKLLMDRQSYMKYAPCKNDYSLMSNNEDLYLEAGDYVTHSGFAIRELRTANFDPLASKQEKIKVFADFWFPRWDVQERANETQRLDAAAKYEALAMRNNELAARAAADSRLKRWNRYGPPPRYANMEPDDFDLGAPEEEAAFDEVMSFVCGDRSTLAVLGNPGTRKTQMVSLWLRRAMLEDGEDGQFIHAFTLAKDAKSPDLIKRYTSVGNLVIDDIGSDSADIEFVLRIVDCRLNNKLTTIYTSNATPTQLKKIYGPRGFSRLMCNAQVVVLNGRDWRIRRDQAVDR